MQLIDKHQQAIEVSTHSRPKAAGGFGKCNARKHRRFNSQPPEGGWAMPPLRGMGLIRVSTHSRPKAAGLVFIDWFGFRICFNSQPPEGGWMAVPADAADVRRFNSQPPEGGWALAE